MLLLLAKINTKLLIELKKTFINLNKTEIKYKYQKTNVKTQKLEMLPCQLVQNYIKAKQKYFRKKGQNKYNWKN